MSKGRKDQFEDQLRDLQKDISNLSQKLSIPPSTINSSRLSSRDTTAVDVEATLQDINKSFSSNASKGLVQTEKGEKLAQLMQEAHVAKREKEDALYRLEQMRAENEEMRKSLQEAVRIKSDYEHLKQDYESIRVSLESSERIRKQQKELINLLQRSHSIGAVASDTGSILSFNSISSIGEAPANTSSRRAADLSSASLAAENREWLNRSMTFPSASQLSQPHTRESATAPHSSRRRSSVSAGMTQSDSIMNGSQISSRPSSAGQDAPLARTGSTPRSTKRTSITATAASKGRRRKSTADLPKPAEHQYSASFHDSAASYSDIVSMNSSLVPNRHGEAVDTSVHRSGANLSAYGIESVTSYQIPVRQGLDSFNTSVRGVSLNQANQTSSGYVPGTYVPGLGTPTLAAHLSHQQGHLQEQDASRLGRPPRHPSMMSPAMVPAGRAATPVHHVPSVPREGMHSFSADPRYAAMVAEQATPTISKMVKRTASSKTKSKKTTTSASPSAAPGAFVRRIPSASPARAATKSPYSVDNKVHTQPHQQALHKPKHHVPTRYATPAGRPAPSPTHLSTFGVSKRIL